MLLMKFLENQRLHIDEKSDALAMGWAGSRLFPPGLAEP